MNIRHRLIVPYAFVLIFLFAHPVWSQESEQSTKQKKSQNSRGMLFLSDQDVILPITSIEWGSPDRWSFTSRYVHMFEKDRNNKTWLNNLSITLSPGISGGRFGIGYQSIFPPPSMPDFGVFSEARVVLLRTWGNPLSTVTNRTFVGAEIRGSLSFLFNIGIGYYTQISDANGNREDFYTFHVGVGI
ncbi:hypothetical protein CEE37_09245 [candidate division LCP-89 bacterium B3_LCP]|uniref:Acyloxyacyl hydrolase n=1 Tax=candidate division LCP-89 bacterium B3_LCP TaxID=2012998 RepID=A0A532UZY8_UNCL8|nr:MAG: hypothetical protein CEE37_09245 [candidate division LCP-89 bacterium B3_LCP]